MRALRNTFYYSIKPWMSPGLRLSMRRWHARRTRRQVGGVWPIQPGSDTPPLNWTGWPHGKKFAFVLTHDVEGPLGLSRCAQVMELESRLGFRSSFNLIPEGPYEVTEEIRKCVRQNGFELGVHDLNHDGRLYKSRSSFVKKAQRINDYLREWNAVGFRSGFMLHNLEWAHDLNIVYDSSTFDTDPFEPQPDGIGTIFPFWVPRVNLGDHVAGAPTRAGYVELPYTLVQDSTLFLVLGERRPDIWFKKLDWLAERGGMALVNIHPDYVAVNGTRCSPWEFPVKFYEQFLEYIRERYSGAYWQVTAAELASWYQSTLKFKSPEYIGVETVSLSGLSRQNGCDTKPASLHAQGPAKNGRVISPASPRANKASKPKIWIDLDNTPHVPFFEPIIEELRARGFPVLVTARDAFQVCALADTKGLQYKKVGRHYGKHMLLKGAGLVYRSSQLAPLILCEKPALGVSHGARSQLLLGRLLHIPTVLIEDYEYCKFAPLTGPTWLMAPDVIPDSALNHGAKVRKYPGIKEDVYAWRLKPEPHALDSLGLNSSDVVVTIRPPATEAHYHNPESEGLFDAVMNRACQTAGLRVVLLPRNRTQGERILGEHPEWFKEGRTVIPGSALDGMNLIWHSDLVVSGGGTMNREAAALGVPVYSIFRGTIGAVDRHLQSQGRLVLLESLGDVQQKLKFTRKPRRSVVEVTTTRTLRYIVDTLQEIAEQTQRASS